MTWSTNITEAQTGDYIWLACPRGKVFKSYWMGKARIGAEKFQDRFCGLNFGEMPVAWQPYVVPPHPFELAKQEEQT